MSSRGQKKNWKYKIKMSQREIKYWLYYLKKNEKIRNRLNITSS